MSLSDQAYLRNTLFKITEGSNPMTPHSTLTPSALAGLEESGERPLKYRKRHVRLTYEGGEVPNGWSCGQCESQWREEIEEVHKTGCPVVRYKTLAAEAERLRTALAKLLRSMEAEGSAMLKLERMADNEGAYDESELTAARDAAVDAVLTTSEAITAARALAAQQGERG